MGVDVLARRNILRSARYWIAVFYNLLALFDEGYRKLVPLGNVLGKGYVLVNLARFYVGKRNRNIVRLVYYQRLFSHLQIPLPQ